MRGVAGKRSEYQPLKSHIAASPDPSVVLRAFEGRPGVKSCYIADLDAIEQRNLNRCTLAEVSRSPLDLIVDRGVRSTDDVQEVLDLGADQAVVALESVPDSRTAESLVTRFGSRRLIFSLDLQNGQPLAASPAWAKSTAIEIMREVLACGYRHMIVLDLASVGSESGVSTIRICEQLRSECPEATIVTGGGIRSIVDLRTLRDAGVDGALVASALHNGAITDDDLNRWNADLTSVPGKP